MDSILEALNFRIKIDGEELAIATAQHYRTNEVLMVAFMNREAFEKTVKKGTVHYFSTSRKKIWHKGEESGHIQEVKEIFIDCDGDSVLFKVEQKGGACHEGFYSCFYRRLDEKRWKVTGEKTFNPSEVYNG
jgi:phosphoribosyl-AMP cyclohydrolase